MIRKFAGKTLACAVALWIAGRLLPGFSVSGGIQGYLVAGLTLGALNTFIRPVLKLLAFPLMMVTMGVFSFVINAGLLWFAARLVDTIVIADLWTLLWATIIVSFATAIFEIGTES